jgi:DNA-binding protein HU-beta
MAATMNKSDVIEAVAKETGLSKTAAGGAVDAVLKTISGALKKGNDVQFTGFGTFAVSKQAARTGVNPQTGEKIKIAARRVAKFRAGKNLKDGVAGK